MQSLKLPLLISLL